MTLPDDRSVAAPDSSVSALATGGALTLSGVVVSGGLGFLLTILITRGLPSVAEAGAFLGAVALFNLVTRLGQLGASTGLIRFFADRRARGDSGKLRGLLPVAVLPVAVSCVILSASMYLLAGQLGQLFASSDVIDSFGTYLRIFAPFVPAGILLDLALGASRGLGTMRPTVLLDNFLRPILQIALVGLALLTTGGPMSVSVGFWLPTAVAAALAWWWLMHRMPPRPSNLAPWRPWGRFWAFAAPRAASGIFAVTMQQAGVLLLGSLATSAAAGIYAATMRYLILGTAVQNAILKAFQPLFTASFAGTDRQATRELFQTATAWSASMTWPIYLTIAVFADTLLLAFGPDYMAGRWAAVVLASAWLVGTALGPVDAALVMAGRSSLSMLNLGVALVVHLTCSFVFIPRYGITGAAFAWMASILVHNLLPLAQVWATMRLQPFGLGTIAALVTSTASFGGVGLMARLFFGPSLTTALLSLCCSTLIYLGLLWWFRDAMRLTVLTSAFRQRLGSQRPGSGSASGSSRT